MLFKGSKWHLHAPILAVIAFQAVYKMQHTVPTAACCHQIDISVNLDSVPYSSLLSVNLLIHSL